MSELYYKILSTGSEGNAVRIDDTLIDCGIPGKNFDKCFINNLIITHLHSDHLKPASVRKLKKLNPNLKIYCNESVNKALIENKIEDAIVVTPGETVDGFMFHTMYHDVDCLGVSFTRNDLDIFYATDTCSTMSVPKELKFDYIFLEANYDYDKVCLLIRTAKHKDLARINQNLDRHLSKQDCFKFYALHKKDKNSKLFKLHQSKQFY